MVTYKSYNLSELYIGKWKHFQQFIKVMELMVLLTIKRDSSGENNCNKVTIELSAEYHMCIIV